MLITRTAIVTFLVCTLAVACGTSAPPESTSTSRPQTPSPGAPTDTPVSVGASNPTEGPTPVATPEPTATPLPEPTATPAPTDTPIPTATPDISGMADDCELAQLKHEVARLLQWQEALSGDTPTLDPLEDELAVCLEFRSQFPDEFLRLIGNTISGTFTLYDDDLFVVTRESPLKGSCWGQRGYDDISIGLDVVIKNAGAKIIATDELWSGKLTGIDECTFPFHVTGVPDPTFMK